MERFQFEASPNFPGILHAIGCHLSLSTYQAGKMIFLSSVDGATLNQVPVSFKKPMGFHFKDDMLVLATLDEVQVFRATRTHIERFTEEPERYDRIYLPRATFYTGALDLHDISIGAKTIWAVNTRFSCLCTFGLDFSFSPRWKPPWISDITPEDRCHLNGMVMVDDKPAYATSLSMTDKKGAWRGNITNSGVLMSVPHGEIIAEGLAMPHSPRLVDGYIYMLLSAKGQLVRVSPTGGAVEVMAELDGFCRGMTRVGHLLFIAMSRLRKSSKTFAKLPVAQMADRAGILVYDTLESRVISHFWYKDTVEEIYELQVYPSLKPPGLVHAGDERHKGLIQTRQRDFFKMKTENVNLLINNDSEHD